MSERSGTLWVFIIRCIVIFFIVSACNPTKYVAEQEYLLKKNTIKINTRGITREELNGYVKQQPNTKMFGFYNFYLWLYNLSDIEKTRFPHGWLRKIGEKPVIYDEAKRKKSVEQLSLFLRNKGYFNAEVTDQVRLYKRRARVSYFIDTKTPFTINNITYTFEDTAIRNVVLADTVNRVLNHGDLASQNLINIERMRIEKTVRDAGYYMFSNKYIVCELDTMQGNNLTNANIILRKNILQDSTNAGIYNRFIIRNIQMQVFNPKATTDTGLQDTIRYNGLEIIHNGRLKISPPVLISSNYILPGQLFSANDVEETYRRMTSLKNFRQVNILFSEPENDDDTIIDCYMRLSRHPKQSYNAGFEGTNSDGVIGGGLNLAYQNNSLFRGAELLNVGMKYILEAVKTDTNQFERASELSIEAQLLIPKFFVPFRAEKFIKRYNPKTVFSLSLNSFRFPDFGQTVMNSRFGYTWTVGSRLRHIINPVEISTINTKYVHPVANTYYAFESFRSHFITSSNYTLVYNNNSQEGRRNSYAELRAESAGNILSGIYDWFNVQDSGNYKIFGNTFARYLKMNIEYRYKFPVTTKTSVAYRVYCGAAYTESKDNPLPYIRSFFSGGANSVRGWQDRSLGPGTFIDTGKAINYLKHFGDVKFESNFEYRFKMFWLLEGAVFIDAGNIWTVHETDRSGGKFELAKFYEQLAVGSGFGIRMDFTFFLLRLDIGTKVKQPYENRWIPVDKGKSFFKQNMVMHFGVGYPF